LGIRKKIIKSTAVVTNIKAASDSVVHLPHHMDLQVGEQLTIRLYPALFDIKGLVSGKIRAWQIFSTVRVRA
jgi:predicted glycoside hydrolase/deacetylase ChbG (UPF0249 family)